MRSVSLREKRYPGYSRRCRGFTLLEMMLTVGIISILLALAFVSLIGARKTAKQLQYDETAKEIFAAAQNHLSLAQAQGLLDNATPEKSGNLVDADSSTYYLFSARDDSPDTSGTFLQLMLPFASIDEGVRVGGSYIIRYQSSNAKVLDVFYTEDLSFVSDDYSLLFTNPGYMGDKKSERRDYESATSGVKGIIGYYGGEGASVTSKKLKAPTVTVDNRDVLAVKVVNPNASEGNQLSLKLIVEGKTSKAAMFFDLIGENAQSDLKKCVSTTGDTNTYKVILDDVTNSPVTINTEAGDIKATSTVGPFMKAAAARPTKTLKKDSTDPTKVTAFVPGEDLNIYAWVTLADGYATVEKSQVAVTNSLFGEGTKYDRDSPTKGFSATIWSFRHLCNLAHDVSGFDRLRMQEKDGSDYVIASVSAKQKTDLSWKSFMEALGDEDGTTTRIQSSTEAATNKAQAGTFLPVQVDYELDYDGGGHRISDVVVNYGGPAGLFGTISKDGSSITGLELVHCNITSTGSGDNGNAGSLAASVSGKDLELSNILVRDGLKKDQTSSVAGTNAVGGLVGSLDANITDTTKAAITGCAAATLVASSSGPAGGLVGNAEKGTITKSYSAGHTKDGKYSGANYVDNVRSDTGAAGGLVGFSAVKINWCYSTCSVQGKTVAGGLVGSITAGDVDNCYAVGLVSGDDAAKKGAFAGEVADGLSPTGQYLKVVSQDMKVVGNDAENADAIAGISAGDANMSSYATFAPTGDTAEVDNGAGGKTTVEVKNSVPYDVTLAKRFGGNYSFRTINQMTGESTAEPKWLSTHYGDWPAYETEVINAKS